MVKKVFLFSFEIIEKLNRINLYASELKAKITIILFCAELGGVE